MKTGKTHNGNVTHLARFVRTVEGFDLYNPMCSRTNGRMVTALCVDAEPQPVTCKKCLAWKANRDAGEARRIASSKRFFNGVQGS